MEVYLDNGATSYPKPECVYEAVNEYMRQNGASPGRGNYAKAMQAEQLVYATRKMLCKLFGIQKPGSIVFTSNITEAINIILKGFLQRGDAVLTSNIEHNAVWRPLNWLEQEREVEIRYFHCTPQGEVDLDEVRGLLSQNVKLLVFTHGSNVLGNILPLAELVALAHEHNVPVLVDSAQTAGALPIQVEELGIDFFAFTGHKSLLAPTGTGGFYMKPGLQLQTLKEGGTGSMAKSPYPPQLPPDRFEAGTLNVFGISGLYAAASYLFSIGAESIRKHEQELIAQLLEGLEEMPEVIYYGPRQVQQRLGLVSFNVKDNDPYKIAKRLDEEFGIMVRAGLHCAPLAHQLLGTQDTGAVRVSLGYANTPADIHHFLASLHTII